MACSAPSPLGSGDSVSAAGVSAETPLPEPVPAAQEEEIADLNQWKGSVNAGVTITDGNTDLTTLSAGGDAKLRREKDRISLGAFWNFQQTKNEVSGANEISQRTSGADAQYDYFMNERTYLFAQASAENNKQADLDLRATVGGGAGHQFLEREDLKLSAEAGPAFVSENFGSSPDSEYLAARGAYDVDWQVNKDWQILHSGVVFPSLEDSDDVYVKLDTRARLTLSESMFAQLQWVFDYDNTPAQGADRQDNRYLLSVGWSF
jgi:putative salt-induced outer membrane protein YdiY